MTGRAALGGVLTVAVIGCASEARPPPAAVPARDPAAEERARDAAFTKGEEQALDVIAAADPRFARRVGFASDEGKRSAAAQALLKGEDESTIHDGGLDFFAFDARGRAIDEAAKIVASTPSPAGATLERALLGRAVDEERARLAEERDLPRAASALLRGVVDTWAAPATRDKADQRDTWLAKRLDEVTASLPSGGLTRPELLELDDSLDPLERLTAGSDLQETTRALARLRVALSDARPIASYAGDEWSRVDAGLRAHLGVAASPADLLARLGRAEHALREDAKLLVAGEPNAERPVAERARTMAFEPAGCGAERSVSRVRALAPPPERAAICGALRALHERDASAVSRAAVAVALHDEIVVAMWALAIHADGVAPARATDRVHPFFGAAPDLEAKWVRYAAARPVAAIGAGLAAEMLSRAPDAAERWLAFGDAPLDVVEREVISAKVPSRASPPR